MTNEKIIFLTPKWSYKQINNPTEDDLNRLGKDEWELVTTNYVDGNHQYIFKKAIYKKKTVIEKVTSCAKKKKPKPKFLIGDTIIKKHNCDINKFGCFPITAIKDDLYLYKDSVICSFDEQDEWELHKVKR